jgi:germination protein YpeB
MQETYYSKQQGIATINYAYTQYVEGQEVTMYPDLIKVKVALDNGEILGMETSGYLNSHEERTLHVPTITMEQAKQSLNANLELTAEGLAVIPTQWQTEIFCYEFKGKVEDREFLVYINAETGEEEDILIILDTENGILTQ